MQIGQKVVCVPCRPNGKGAQAFSIGAHKAVGELPVVGKVYVIKELHFYSELGLSLIGSTAIHIPTGVTCGWCHKAFRTLEEMKAKASTRQTQSSQV